MTQKENYSYDEKTAHDLTTTAETIVKIDASSSSHVSLQIDGNGDAADYAVDVSEDGDTWYNNIERYQDTSRVNDGFIAGERFVRIRRTSSEPSGTANVLLSAKN